MQKVNVTDEKGNVCKLSITALHIEDLLSGDGAKTHSTLHQLWIKHADEIRSVHGAQSTTSGMANSSGGFIDMQSGLAKKEREEREYNEKLAAKKVGVDYTAGIQTASTLWVGGWARGFVDRTGFPKEFQSDQPIVFCGDTS